MIINHLVPILSRNHPSARGGADPFRDAQLEVNRLFDEVLHVAPIALRRWDRATGAMVFEPRVDVSETEHELKVSAELPGMEEKDVSVEADAETLTIQGEKREEKEDKARNWHCREQTYGSFQRIIPLPSGVESDKITATFRKGVLTVTIPKKEEPQARRKTIKVEAA